MITSQGHKLSILHFLFINKVEMKKKKKKYERSKIKLKKLKLSIKSNGSRTSIRIFKVISLKESSLQSPGLLYIYNWISNKK